MARRPDGTIVLGSRVPPAPWEESVPVVLREHAAAHPDRPLAAQRDGQDRWVPLTYGEARARADALGQSFLELGLGPDRPLLVLSGNSLEHLVVTLGAYTAGVPVVPISVAYSLMSADHARIRAIAELVDPGLVFVEDAGPFAAALDALAGPRRPGAGCPRRPRRSAAPRRPAGDQPERSGRRRGCGRRPRHGGQAAVHVRLDRPRPRESSTPIGCCAPTRRCCVRSGRSWPPSHRCSSTGCRGATRSAPTTT